jgi:hypothetical protein
MPEDSFDKKITERFSKDTVKRAEKLIDGSEQLRAARSAKDGLKPVYGGQTHGGKGSAPRVNIHSKQYQDNWEKIFGKKDDKDKDK